MVGFWGKKYGEKAERKRAKSNSPQKQRQSTVSHLSNISRVQGDKQTLIAQSVERYSDSEAS